MSKNTSLLKAKKAKNDEFYTQLPDIERELSHYLYHFQDKVVLCNCDTEQSHFWEYFTTNFHKLHLKKVIAIGLNADRMEYDGSNIVRIPLDHDGSFSNKEGLDEADIVVTNPPYSLFRKYIEMVADKKFLIVGSLNAVTYKEVFKLIKAGKLWLGYTSPKEFEIPAHYPLIGSSYIDSSGRKMAKAGNSRWFTNLPLYIPKDPITPNKKYDPESGKTSLAGAEVYPKYDNYDAINVDKVKDIPKDYWKPVGVPITFLDKHNPEQFEIIKFRKGDDDKDLSVGGKCPYFRIVIKRIK